MDKKYTIDKDFGEALQKISKQTGVSVIDLMTKYTMSHIPKYISHDPIGGYDILNFEKVTRPHVSQFEESDVVEDVSSTQTQIKDIRGKVERLQETTALLRQDNLLKACDIRDLKNLAEERHKTINYLWSALVASVIFSACCFVSLLQPAKATDMIIGDSHVGGLKPYLNKHMVVRFKNGSTTDYWLKQPTYPVNKLVIHTGTNEQFSGVSPQEWLRKTQSLCWKWNPHKCYIVAPPANSRGNYQAYRSVLYPQHNIIYTQANGLRDGVHYQPSGYKRMASQILSVVKSN